VIELSGWQALALSPTAKLLLQVGLSIWMVAISVSDHRTGRIPNAMTAPVILGMGAYRLLEGFLGEPVRFLLLAAWALIFVLWMLHFIGGGDAKFLMALYALFPTMEFTAVLAFFLLVVTLPLLLWEMRGRAVTEVGRSVRNRVLTGELLPTEAELHERGRRYAWTFAIPGLVYTWLYW
jgi:leader peptidase (prepilin peptidase)/N-methyltransferase